MHFKAQRSALVKEQIWDIMHYGRGHAGSVFNVVLVILILFSCAILPVEFFRNDLVVFKAIEVAITIIFTMEYALRIYAAPNKKRYITSFYGIVDLVSVAPFYLGLFATQYVRMLRLVRLIRLLKLSRVEASASTQKDSAKEVGLLAGEKVDFVVSRHPLILIIGLFPVLVALSTALVIYALLGPSTVSISIMGTLIVFSCIFLWKALLDYNFDVIYVTSHRLIFQNWHLLGRNTNQVNYRAITNVKPKYTGIWSYILGFGSIIIETPSVSRGVIEHGFVKQHEKAAHSIMQRCVEHENPGVSKYKQVQEEPGAHPRLVKTQFKEQEQPEVNEKQNIEHSADSWLGAPPDDL